MAKSTSASGFAQCTAAALKQFFDYFFDFPHAVYDATLTSLSKLCPPLFTFFKHSNTDDRLQLKLFIGKLTEVCWLIDRVWLFSSVTPIVEEKNAQSNAVVHGLR